MIRVRATFAEQEAKAVSDSSKKQIQQNVEGVVTGWFGFLTVSGFQNNLQKTKACSLAKRQVASYWFSSAWNVLWRVGSRTAKRDGQ